MNWVIWYLVMSVVFYALIVRVADHEDTAGNYAVLALVALIWPLVVVPSLLITLGKLAQRTKPDKKE